MSLVKEKHLNQTVYGYAGKILRINLTNSTTEIIPSSKYLPEYLGGREAANRIWWDEVKGPVGAFEPENKLIFMTGAACATGIPASGRAIMPGVGACNIPEQYTHGCIGGFFAGTLKFAGYDGFILEGKAPEHTYVLIEDDKVQFLNADNLWGRFVHDTQETISQLHGADCVSLVIGPAGEHLCRNASITTSQDNAFAKTGFGAVFGSKNLKAIAVRGTGSIRASSAEKVLQNRRSPFHETRTTEPYVQPPEGAVGYDALGICKRLVGCMGCENHCTQTVFDFNHPFEENEKAAMVIKCVDSKACFGFTHSDGYMPWARLHSRRQEKPGSYHWIGLKINDPEDPDLAVITKRYPGDRVDLWDYNPEFGATVNWLCNQYGLDKWEMIEWYFTWLVMAQKEGLLDDLDFGFEIKVGDPEFAKKFIHMVAYREGELGNIFAEGMGYAIRILGKEKYGDAPYHGRFNCETGENLEIPISWEASWGQSNHWQGRGNEVCPEYEWLNYSMCNMIDNRDATAGHHAHAWMEEYRSFGDDLVHCDNFLNYVVKNCGYGEMKDILLGCDWRTPNITWPEQEAAQYSIATGIEVTEDDLFEEANRSRLLYRAILMRGFKRTRDMEAEEMFPWLTYPDPWGRTLTWDEWNDMVDRFYTALGWDIATGWPKRETWEKAGLSDVADELESLGLMPDPAAPYSRKESPFEGHFRKKESSNA